MANISGPLDAMAYVQGQGDRGAALGREQFTQRNAGQIIGGDPAAYARLAAVDPAAAKQAQGASDDQMKRMEGLITYMKGVEAKNPAAAQAAWVAHGVPYVRQFANGTEPTQDWTQAKQMLGNLEARIAMAKAGHVADTMPAGFQEAHQKAIAAGFEPGSPEYQNAMRVNLGVVGRAATGGFGFEKVTGSDGRERLARKNPRTGVVEIYDEQTGDFVPMGGGAGLNPGEPTPQAAPAPGALVAGEVPFSIDPSLPPEVQAAIRANPQGAANVPDGGTLPMPAQGAGPIPVANTAPAPTQAAQAPRGANPGLGVSRPPEEQAAATTAAQEAAKTAALAEQERIKADAAVRQANEIARGKVDVEVGAKQGQKERDAVNTLDLLDDIEKLLPGSTGGGAAELTSDIAAYFGHTTEGRAKIAAIAPMAAKLVGYVPRFEGPQSDKDVQLYRDAAGDLANPKKPVGERLAALYQLRSLAMKYAGSTGAGASSVGGSGGKPATKTSHSHLWGN